MKNKVTTIRTFTARLAITLVLAMLMCPICGYAQNTWNLGTEGDWEYGYRGGVAMLTSYNGTEESITTPTTLGGNRVTIISTNFSVPNTTLKSITISEGVAEIQTGAFQNKSSLTSVSLPTSLVIIEEFAFQGCSSLTSIVLPASMQTINERIFQGCTSLASVSILGNVTSIGESAFSECSALKSIGIPASVTDIDEHAFHLSGLEDVWYNGSKAGWENVTVGTDAFSSWSNTNGVFTPTIHWYCMAT